MAVLNLLAGAQDNSDMIVIIFSLFDIRIIIDIFVSFAEKPIGSLPIFGAIHIEGGNRL
jgi:hypothetical protein